MCTHFIKKIIQETKLNPLFSSPTILFIDEIHRFNKAQQDSFLPYIEDGTIILVEAKEQRGQTDPSQAVERQLVLKRSKVGRPKQQAFS